MEQRNLLLAIVLSLGILLFFQAFFAPPAPPPRERQVGEAGSDGSLPRAETENLPGAPAEAGGTAVMERAEAMAESPRVSIDNPVLRGSISRTGARIDDLILNNYRETVETDSEDIVLLDPQGTVRPYYASFGWTSTDSSLALPKSDTVWESDRDSLAPGRPVTLTWDNGQGLTFEQRLSLDENYLFEIAWRVENRGDKAVTLSPYGLVSRTGTPDILGFYILHEGLIGVFDEQLTELDYDDLRESGEEKHETAGGWIGITDKYWLVALIPDQERAVKARFLHDGRGGADKYQTDFLYAPVSIPAGGDSEAVSRLFAGAKEVGLLDDYAEELAIPLFDRAVDFGWFYFLTKPLFQALHYIAGVSGNFGIAILVLTVGIKLLFFPLANKSYAAMAKMRKVQPEMLKLRERHGDDKQKLNQEMMALYKREGANPLAGCLPILIQIPVFFALYKVLFVTIEMRHAPFFGWVRDLSARDPTSILNLFGLMPWGVPALGPLEIVSLGVWPILMGLTMFLQQKLNPQPADPLQAKIFLFMPIIFTFLLASFPAGLVIYWTWNNLLSIVQQAVIMKRAGVPLGGKAAPTTPSKT